MTTLREAAQQALDALEYGQHTLKQISENQWESRGQLAMQALRDALAEPVQEPVAWGVFDGPNLHDVNFTEEEAHEMVRLKGDGSVVKPLYTSTQPQMQPCAGRNCGSTNPNLHPAECFEDYEKSTGMNQWQGLTDEEINSVRYNRDWTAPWTDLVFARAIEAKLKEKNHG